MRVTRKHVVYTSLFALVVVSAFILYIGYVTYSPINRQAVARIQPGMVESQVEAILGGPCAVDFPMPKNKQDAARMKMWHDAHGARCTVLFDASGGVVFAGFHEPANRGVIGLFRDALRLR